MSESAIDEKLNLQVLRGMKDIMPREARLFRYVEEMARSLFEKYGYGEIRTPVIEPTELFARSVGEASDLVVSKQMYTFVDPGERSNTLRPEGTAGVVRAMVESGALKEAAQQKVFYLGPMFRYEKPQKGRQRQFHQIGVEFFGVEHPAADAEVITMCDTLLRRLGFQDVATNLNVIGCRECRRAYNERLREAIREIAEAGGTSAVKDPREWCEQCLTRAEVNPMRVFDCKVESCKTLVQELPSVAEFVCENCQRHFDGLLKLLDEAGIPYKIDEQLVRGLDYYSRAVFEVTHGGLGAQNALLGGGRYDYLVEELGGPATPAVGMSIGMERLLLAMESVGIKLPEPSPCEFYILALDEDSVPAAFRLARIAREQGSAVAFDCQPRSARAGLKAANRVGARVAIIIGADELARQSAQWKNLESSEQIELTLEEIERNLVEQ